MKMIGMIQARILNEPHYTERLEVLITKLKFFSIIKRKFK